MLVGSGDGSFLAYASRIELGCMERAIQRVNVDMVDLMHACELYRHYLFGDVIIGNEKHEVWFLQKELDMWQR